MKYNRKQLVEMLLEEDKKHLDLTDQELLFIRWEYNRELLKLAIYEADKFETFPVSESFDTIIDFGFDSKVKVWIHGTCRLMFWENESPV